MISLTRLNGHTIAVNAALIQWIENSPDTTLTLLTGEKLVVSEAYAEVIAAAAAFFRTQGPMSGFYVRTTSGDAQCFTALE